MGREIDFTRPWLRGMKLIPRKGKEPPRLEPLIKTVPIVDEKGKPTVPQILRGIPGKKTYEIKLK